MNRFNWSKIMPHYVPSGSKKTPGPVIKVKDIHNGVSTFGFVLSLDIWKWELRVMKIHTLGNLYSFFITFICYKSEIY